jgi:hypothetical protein
MTFRLMREYPQFSRKTPDHRPIRVRLTVDACPRKALPLAALRIAKIISFAASPDH